jgi:hypothetical protein
MVLYFVCQNERVHSPSDCSLAHPRNHESTLTTWVKALSEEETHLLAVSLGEVDDEAARRLQWHQRPRTGTPQLRVDRRRLVKSVERRRLPHRRAVPPPPGPSGRDKKSMDRLRAGEELGGRALPGDLDGEGAARRGRWSRLPLPGELATGRFVERTPAGEVADSATAARRARRRENSCRDWSRFTGKEIVKLT